MKRHAQRPLATGAAASLAASLAAALAAALACAPATAPIPEPAPAEVTVSFLASGTFEVRLNPEAGEDHSGGVSLARMSMDKVFHGDLEGTSRGEMLTARTAVPTSAGYVAIERVTGTLHGRTGTFVLQHTGTMAGGDQALSVTVVPDSGTGDLAGIAGRMSIIIEGGAHRYELEYTLPEP